MFGKLAGESLNSGRTVAPDRSRKAERKIPSNSSHTSFNKFIALIDYVIAHAEGDQRPYLEVSVLGRTLLGLLDSGSSATLISEAGLRTFLDLGLKLNRTKQIKCTVANGNTCTTIGTVSTPMCLMGKVRMIEVLVVPHLSSHLILGSDFWLSMDVVPDLKRNVWHFGQEDIIPVSGIKDENSLTPEERDRLESQLEEMFERMGTGLGFTTVSEHEIVLKPGTTPIKQRYYPVSPYKQKIMDDELKKMLEMDIIEPSKSSWSSPVLLVPKKDKSYRFCVDYRALNAVTRKDAYPLPYVSAILDRLRGAKYLSSMDIKSAYWQISVKEECRELTAFTIPGRGLFHFKRMPFGLSNAPASWQRLIDQVLGADLEPYVFVYLDDIIVFSPDFQTHLELLRKVFDRLTAAGLTLSKEKCKFCCPSLKYLGFVVDSQGVHVDVEKVEAILKVPPPTSATEVRRFLGMAGWYRKFVPGFSTKIAPLTKLIQKRKPFQWTTDCEAAFCDIKNHLVTAPILTCPDFSRPFILQTDASAYGLGAVLTQNFDDGEKVICFLSRSLTRLERNYSTTERECLSVIWAVEKLRHYLEGSHFIIVTDHASLVWLNNLKDPTGRLARWAIRLQPFDYTIVHRKGKDNVVPDFLSRSVPVTISAIDAPSSSIDFKNTTDPWYLKMKERILDHPRKFRQWRVENGVIYKYVRCAFPELSSQADYWKLVVPKDSRSSLIRLHHDDERSGHIGIYKTFWKLHRRYTWPKMQADVARYVRSCQVCAQHKPEQKSPAGHMGTRPEIRKPWQMISLDYVGPLPRSKKGNSYLLVISDYFSKYILLQPFRSAKAKSLAQYVEERIFYEFGVPQYIICDNGKQMRSKEFQNLCGRYHAKISYTANYYPRADPVERYNRIVKTMISCYSKDNHRSWDENLAAIGCAIRTSKSETTGFTPYFINFGREYVADGSEYHLNLEDAGLDTPLETEVQKRNAGFRKLFDRVRTKIKNAQERSRRVYNLRRRSVQYNVGDAVWRKNKILSDASRYITAKLSPKFVGPYYVKKKLGSWTYELVDDKGKSIGVWHVQDLKPFVGPNSDQEDTTWNPG